jgi:hypothetical protein
MLHFREIFDFDFRFTSETSIFEILRLLFDISTFSGRYQSVVLFSYNAKFSFGINQFKSISFSWKLKSI